MKFFDIFKKKKEEVNIAENMEKVRNHIFILTKENSMIADELKNFKEKKNRPSSVVSNKIQQYKRNMATLERLKQIENAHLEMEVIKLNNEAIRAMSLCAKDVKKKMKGIDYDDLEENLEKIADLHTEMEDINEIIECNYSGYDINEDNISNELEDIIYLEKRIDQRTGVEKDEKYKN